MIADLSRRSSLCRIVFYCTVSCLSAINEASLLKTTVAVDPNLPVVEKRNQTQFPECVVHMHVSCPVQHGGSTVVKGLSLK